MKTADEGVQILVDGKEQGMSPLDGPLYVAPGSHTLEGKRGTATASTQFDAVAGQSQEVTLNLSEGQLAPFPEAAEAPGKARLEESAPPEADSGPGRQSFGSWSKSPIGIVLWSAVGAGVATGVVALGISIDASNSAGTTQANILAQYAKDYPDAAHQSHGPCNPPPNNAYWSTCQEYVNLRDRRDTFQVVSIISFIGAGAAGVAIPIVYFTTAKRVYRADQTPKAHRASIDVLPLTSPNFQGISLTGRF